MTVDYDPTIGTLCTALRLKDTVITMVFGRFEFWVLLSYHGALRYAYEMDYYKPSDFNMTLPLGLTGVTGSLMTFFVVFYNGNVFGRYNKLYELTKNLNESCLYVVMLLTREIKDQALKRKLVKMILASCFLFFFERTPNEGSEGGAVSKAEWGQLVRLGLLDDEQLKRLKAHCRNLTKNSMPSLKLLNWSMKLYRIDAAKNNELEKAYWNVRRMQDDVVELLELPMPWQYFHIMNMMMMLNLMLWAYSFAFEESYFASLIFVFLSMIFMGIRELSVALADPYGDDAADFPLNEWINQLYVRVLDLCEDTWEAKDMVLNLVDEPLPEVERNCSVVDLLTDLPDEQRKPKGKRSSLWKKGNTAHASTAGGADELPAPDGSGAYVKIPNTEADNEDSGGDD